MYMKALDFLEYELKSLEGESVDKFNWGVRRASSSNMEGELIGGLEQHLPQHKPEGAEESNDEELESVSPVDELSARSAEEHSEASGCVITASSGVNPPSSLSLEVGSEKRSSTPHSETESGECSEGEMSDLTSVIRHLVCRNFYHGQDVAALSETMWRKTGDSISRPQ